ncbi:MAG: threonine synthase [Xanthomonadales bacterium]|nr:threonine synthase [Xanthomonadales bacterium]
MKKAMAFINIDHRQQQVSFAQAVVKGLGKNRGLFFPRQLSPLQDIPALLRMDFIDRSTVILQHLAGPEIQRKWLEKAFDFPLPLNRVSERVHALELFHGPSLAFKDFGARFMAQCLAEFSAGKKTTILTATSGDTGAAVAQAFYGQEHIDVVVLYPRGKVTPLQEKLFCTLGGNIRTVAVEDDFDACQDLVKQSFDDPELVQTLGLNSANSINVARLLAQVCYYFEALAKLPPGTRPVFSVPSGNFGNVTAALLAIVVGLPAKRVIAATNCNDTVPRFFKDGRWDPKPTVATLTNAMDISLPNNFPRVLELQKNHGLNLPRLLTSFAVDDAETRLAVRELDDLAYLADPHSALAWKALSLDLAKDETGVFLCTAHPAKFIETIEDVLQKPITLPRELERVCQKDVLSTVMPADYHSLREFLLSR